MRVPVERELHLEALRGERRDPAMRSDGSKWPGGQSFIATINMRQRMLFSTFTNMFLTFRTAGASRLDGHDERRGIGLRGALGEQKPDVGTCLVRCRSNQLCHILPSKVRRQQADPAHVQPPLLHRVEDRGELPRRAGRLDALGGRVLGHVQFAQAVLVHRGVRRRQVELPLVRDGDVGQRLRGVRASLRNDRSQAGKHDVIGETVHLLELHRVIHRGGDVSRGQPPLHTTPIFGARTRPHASQRGAARETMRKSTRTRRARAAMASWRAARGALSRPGDSRPTWRQGRTFTRAHPRHPALPRPTCDGRTDTATTSPREMPCCPRSAASCA